MAKRKNKSTIEAREKSKFSYYSYTYIDSWVLVETVLLSLLDSIGAIVTEDITSGSERLTELLLKITESTGVNITKVCFQFF